MLVEIKNKKEWNELAFNQPRPSGAFLQSWEWGEFQKKTGKKVFRFSSDDGSAQIIELPLPFGQKYWFIPRGPNLTDQQTIYQDIQVAARKKDILFLRFEPPPKTMIPVPAIRTVLASPPQTLILNLMKSEDELLAAMQEKTRYNLRLALKKEVKIRQGQFSEFWEMLGETARRDKFRTHPLEYYQIMLKTESVHLHLAYHQTTPLAGAIVVYFGDTATYLHGASSHQYRALMGPYALHWHIILEAKKQGYKFYDLWGIDEKKWPGLTRFKIGFGGEIIESPGAYDLPVSRFGYKLYRTARQVHRLLNNLRRL